MSSFRFNVFVWPCTKIGSNSMSAVLQLRNLFLGEWIFIISRANVNVDWTEIVILWMARFSRSRDFHISLTVEPWSCPKSHGQHVTTYLLKSWIHRRIIEMSRYHSYSFVCVDIMKNYRKKNSMYNFVCVDESTFNLNTRIRAVIVTAIWSLFFKKFNNFFVLK